MIETKNLELKEARQIIDAMVEHYTVTKPGRPGSHAVVDSAGTLVCIAKMDGASMLTRNMAENKAYTAIVWKRNTRWLRKFIVDAQLDIVWFGGDLKYAPIPGGVPIVTEDGTIVGAVGSSGRTGDEDEEVCLVGIKAAGLKPLLA